MRSFLSSQTQTFLPELALKVEHFCICTSADCQSVGTPVPAGLDGLCTLTQAITTLKIELQIEGISTST